MLACKQMVESSGADISSEIQIFRCLLSYYCQVSVVYTDIENIAKDKFTSSQKLNLRNKKSWKAVMMNFLLTIGSSMDIQLQQISYLAERKEVSGKNYSTEQPMNKELVEHNQLIQNIWSKRINLDWLRKFVTSITDRLKRLYW